MFEGVQLKLLFDLFIIDFYFDCCGRLGSDDLMLLDAVDRPATTAQQQQQQHNTEIYDNNISSENNKVMDDSTFNDNSDGSESLAVDRDIKNNDTLKDDTFEESLEVENDLFSHANNSNNNNNKRLETQGKRI